MFLAEVKRILSRPIIYISIIVGLFLINRPLLESLLSGNIGSGSISQFLSVPFAMSDFTPFAAIFCSLPFSDSFCEDYNTGYVRQIANRSGIRKYSLIKCIAVALSGGISMALIIAGTIVFCGLLADSPDTAEKIEFMKNSIWVKSGVVFLMNGFLYLAMRVLFAFLFGCVWALIGLLVSTFFTNKYVTYIAPFVIYQFMWFIFNEKKWNPVYLLRGDSNFIPSISFVILYQSFIILVLVVLSSRLIWKKVVS